MIKSWNNPLKGIFLSRYFYISPMKQIFQHIVMSICISEHLRVCQDVTLKDITGDTEFVADQKDYVFIIIPSYF